MTNFRAPSLVIAAAAILVGTTVAALADPPARVGRLSDVEGTVSFHTADQTDWSPATLNYPVTSGTSFWTEPNSRTEIQVGAAEVRMDQATALSVVRLDDAATQLQVDQGVINVHVLTLPPGGIAVITPLGQVDLQAPGSYDINAGAPNGTTPPTQMQLSVLEGAARFDGPRSAVDVQAGEAATIGGNPLNVSLAEASPTPFDDWALGREHREAASQAVQYVPPGTTGYQDLDDNGQWAATPDYGEVWYPTAMPVGWAPYQFGHWAFVRPWGWTWIDDAPWGFAPFHYGRWAVIDGRWGWAPVVPGVAMARPVYAPALVAFVGGGGFGVSLSIGGSMAAVGWVPLAPFEPFHPWYRASPGYLRSVNVINVRPTDINSIGVVNATMTIGHFANRNAAVVVSAQAFTHAAPVQRATVAVPREQLAQVRVAATMHDFKATPEARAAFARPNAAGVEHANLQATVARTPVAYHAEAVAPGQAASTTHAPGPQIRHTAAVTAAQRLVAHPTAQAVRPPAAQPHAAGPRKVAQPRPQMQVQRPAQQTHLAATPQGWQRQPAPQHPAASEASEKDKPKN